MTDLKPCPFCGGEGVITWADGGSTTAWIACKTCGAKGAWARGGHGGSAADEWNRRVDNPPERPDGCDVCIHRFSSKTVCMDPVQNCISGSKFERAPASPIRDKETGE